MNCHRTFSLGVLRLYYWQFMIIFQPARGLLQRCQVLNEIWLELPAWIQLYNFVPRSLVSAWIWNVTDSDHNIGRIRQPQREGGSSHSPWQSLREGFFHKKFLGTTHFLVRSIPWEKWGLKSCKNQNFKTPKNRARGNRKTLKRLKTMSKLNFRNLKLKSHEEYLIRRTYFVW